MTKTQRILGLLASLVVLGSLGAGCKEKSESEKAADAIKEAAEQTEKAAKEAAKKAEDALRK